MNSYFNDYRFSGQSSNRPIPANEINNRVKRIERGEASGKDYNQYNSYSDGYGGSISGFGGTGNSGEGFSGDGLGDLLIFILYALGGGDE